VNKVVASKSAVQDICLWLIRYTLTITPSLQQLLGSLEGYNTALSAFHSCVPNSMKSQAYLIRSPLPIYLTQRWPYRYHRIALATPIAAPIAAPTPSPFLRLLLPSNSGPPKL
jgi:hypothetical protein